MSAALLAALLALAPWTDTTTVAAAPPTVATVPAPVLRCTGGIGGVTFSWDAVPGATAYTLTTSQGELRTTATRLAVPSLVGQGTASLRAEIAYPAVTWTSAPSAPVDYAVLLVGSC